MIRPLLPLLMLAGCTPTVADGALQPGTDKTAPTQGACRIDGLTDLVGKHASEALVTDALKRSGARSSRSIGPDTMVTMDFKPDRLNIHTDAAGTVTHFRCG
ncbi:peptidase inhibitor I78 [Sphingomonas sp. PL-96]|uniref:I78 family peptidase inhibitor n=1 Tax=Sphingomonas sp. PL-96 TaxID=2887201 RepID=UPI001E43F7AD|nr:I78 family peptidase inhibitor [Sphingomonas sp. PL-96]MCC2976030.1 peptidase inhibitor I78 [Sphingomonas sp. PL-96]